MRARISKKNVQFFLKQQYAFTTMKQFFELTEHHPSMRSKVLKHLVKEFTDYELKDGKLYTYNPYTSKKETLNIESFKHITNTEELFKDLSMLHKMRLKMLEQSRERILELAQEKKFSRDNNLEVIMEKTIKSNKNKDRLKELVEEKKSSQTQDLER